MNSAIMEQTTEKLSGYTVAWFSEFGRENDEFEHLGDARLYSGIVSGKVYEKASGALVSQA